MCDELKKNFSPREAAEIMGVSESSVKRWIDNGRLPAGKTVGGHRRIEASNLVKFMRSQGIKSQSGQWSADENVSAGRSEGFGRFFAALEAGNGIELQILLQNRLGNGESLETIIDEIIFPAYRNLRDSCPHPSERCHILHRAVEQIRKVTGQFATDPHGKAGRPRLVCADMGYEIDGLPTYLAEAVTRDLVDCVQIGTNAPEKVVKGGLADENTVLFWLSASGDIDAGRRQEIINVYKYALRAGVRTAVFGDAIPQGIAPQLNTLSAFRGFVQGVLAASKRQSLSAAVNF